MSKKIDNHYRYMYNVYVTQIAVFINFRISTLKHHPFHRNNCLLFIVLTNGIICTNNYSCFTLTNDIWRLKNTWAFRKMRVNSFYDIIYKFLIKLFFKQNMPKKLYVSTKLWNILFTAEKLNFYQKKCTPNFMHPYRRLGWVCRL